MSGVLGDRDRFDVAIALALELASAGDPEPHAGSVARVGAFSATITSGTGRSRRPIGSADRERVGGVEMPAQLGGEIADPRFVQRERSAAPTT